jgi:predicted small integral membrane protein
MARRRKAADQSGGLAAFAILAGMNSVAPFFCHIRLMLALLARWMRLWAPGAKPPPGFVKVLEQTEERLAEAIRGTLTEDGVAFPALADRAFLKWFGKHAPGLGPSGNAGFSRKNVGRLKLALPASARPVRSALVHTRAPKAVAHPAGLAHAGQALAARRARAPPGTQGRDFSLAAMMP